MSSLRKTILQSKLPPRVPKNSSKSKLAPFGAGVNRDYSPLPWKSYFDKYVDVETSGGTFRVYLSPEPDQPDRPRIVTLHGGGYSGLSWALFSVEITEIIHCQVVSMDIRGHGETKALDPDDLSMDTLANDVNEVLHKLYGTEFPSIVLMGHSMGGAIAVRAALLPELEPHIQGLAVIDVVEGTAMESLASMQSFLRSRPTHFRSIEHAIEWCIRSGQVRNHESARVSMPSQIVNCETGLLAINEVIERSEEDSATSAPSPKTPRTELYDSNTIVEETDGQTDAQEDKSPDDSASLPKLARTTLYDKNTILEETDEQEDKPTDGEILKPPCVPDNMKYTWRIDLSRTERHWSGWFSGLSAAFLSARAPRLLLLASIDGLDRELTVGQMQGKFQLAVLARCGHAVHEESARGVASTLAAFLLRMRRAQATPAGALLHLVNTPAC